MLDGKESSAAPTALTGSLSLRFPRPYGLG
jgi:hypothetical protein